MEMKVCGAPTKAMFAYRLDALQNEALKGHVPAMNSSNHSLKLIALLAGRKK